MRTSYYISLPIFATIISAALSACGGGTETNSSMSSSGAKTAATIATTDSTTATWTQCATEGGTCNLSGTNTVRYGTSTAYVTKTVTGPVACSNAVFGDPASGYAKTCSVASAPSTSTSASLDAASTTLAWTQCATEGGTCNVSGTAQVRYGTATQYVTKSVTGPVVCSNAVFGDPASGYAKTCSIGTALTTNMTATPTPTPTPSGTWTQCATEGGTCSFSGTTGVRYGTATAYVTKSVTGPVSCSNSVFGDPAPGFAKACSIGGTTSTSTSSPTTTDPTSTSPSTSPSTASPSTPVVGTGITAVQLLNTTTTAQTDAAATFGQVFAQGDVLTGETLVGKTASGVTVPVQVDVKARHADGSLRHAVITTQLPNIAASGNETVSLIKGTGSNTSAATAPTALLTSGFTASFTATIGGVQYTASADALLKAGKYTTWLSGPLVNEWIVSAPLQTSAGVAHPHLMAQFAIRSYTGSNSARVDVTIENGWAFQGSPQNFTYDAKMLVGGQSVFSQAALTHYHHARWRKVFWWGKTQPLNVRHNLKYLLATKALPNYDQTLPISETAIASWKSSWDASKNGPMQPGVGQPYMPTTGSRSDIGLMPAWSALYLLSQDQRMKNISLGMSDAAGAWSTHYRDKNTGRPVTLSQYPYMSIITSGNDTINPATHLSEAFPDCPATLCTTPMTADTAHQAAFSYVPYLVTGDYYHLEELQFYANFSSFYNNPGYRQNLQGLVQSDQVRAQAWTLRTIAEAAYITPDNDSQKANFNAIVNYNLDWYNTTYTNNAAANKLGTVVNGYAVEYDSNTGLAPWQDDFFTAVTGRMVELGFTKALPLLTWKSKFATERVIGTGFCWIEGSKYSMKVRDSATAAFYTTIGQVYQASNTAAFNALACASSAMASSLGLRIGEMDGGSSASGQQAIMQPALSYTVGVNANGAKAWSVFTARPYKPDFSSEPQYAIVPR